jgi:hypothetical protein
VSAEEFLASPTWLDSQDLVSKGSTLQQGNELTNQLIKASGWAWTLAEQNLAAHKVYAQDRFPVDRWGNVYIVPGNSPVRSVDGLAWGSDFQNLTVLSLPSTQVWVERTGRASSIIVAPYPAGYSKGLSDFQFGGRRAAQDYVYVQYLYTAGYCVTTLAEDAISGATQINLTDPTGLQPGASSGLLGAIPGSIARIWDPADTSGSTGGEEAIRVSPAWVAGTNPVLLTAPLAHNHAAGAAVDELPPEVHQAVIALTVALLCREDTAGDEPFSRTSFGPTVRESKSGGKAGGLVDHAKLILHRYRPKVH